MGKVFHPSQCPYPCAMCSLKPAVVHCHMDLMRLCESCDASYHSTRQNHARFRICNSCGCATTAYRRHDDDVVCSNCDNLVYQANWVADNYCGMPYTQAHGAQVRGPFLVSRVHFFDPSQVGHLLLFAVTPAPSGFLEELVVHICNVLGILFRVYRFFLGLGTFREKGITKSPTFLMRRVLQAPLCLPAFACTFFI
jgi:hypothetical protein